MDDDKLVAIPKVSIYGWPRPRGNTYFSAGGVYTVVNVTFGGASFGGVTLSGGAGGGGGCTVCSGNDSVTVSGGRGGYSKNGGAYQSSSANDIGWTYNP